MLNIFSYMFPAIPFVNEHVPILSLLRHPFTMKMGTFCSYTAENLNPITIKIEPIWEMIVVENTGDIYICPTGNNNNRNIAMTPS